MLYVDGVQGGETQAVTADHSLGEWQDFEFTIDLPNGASSIRVEFPNDAAGPGGDRNLYIDHIEVNDVRLEPEEALYDRFSGSDIDGQTGMFWSGALDFDVSARQDQFSQTRGDGNDVLLGGTGNDSLFGGAGNDTFVFDSINDGDDMILDFVLTEDTVDMDALLDVLGAATGHRALVSDHAPREAGQDRREDGLPRPLGVVPVGQVRARA